MRIVGRETDHGHGRQRSVQTSARLTWLTKSASAWRVSTPSVRRGRGRAQSPTSLSTVKGEEATGTDALDGDAGEAGCAAREAEEGGGRRGEGDRAGDERMPRCSRMKARAKTQWSTESVWVGSELLRNVEIWWWFKQSEREGCNTSDLDDGVDVDH